MAEEATWLPILWSNRAGAEVMRPLVVPIVGGMFSSLVCILIVTPVIFEWLREQKLKSSDHAGRECHR